MATLLGIPPWGGLEIFYQNAFVWMLAVVLVIRSRIRRQTTRPAELVTLADSKS